MDAPISETTRQLTGITRRYWKVGGAALILILIALAYWYVSHARQSGASYTTAAVAYGDVTQTVSANGTLNPVIEVNVGSQVSGTVQKLYADFNSRVHKGQVLCVLDPTLFKAQVAQSLANLHSAEANLELAVVNEQRLQKLQSSGYAAQSDLDQAAATRKSAQAQVELATAQLRHDQTNLAYTVIRSPVDGVVINRVIDVGQTVAASFQTPTLFVIGQNLRNMQIDVTVDEADIGQIKAGQAANFTVDAYPERKFSGRVTQIRLNPTIVQNVVTYDVVIGVDNRDELLLPGMTAYVNVVVQQLRHVLLVPNAALRVRIPGAGPAPAQQGEITASSGIVYVYLDGKLRSVAVKTGASDGKQTEIASGDLREGERVVVGFASPEQAAKRHPFQLF
ncbi:MAG: efflux RND transporter periplasmic adaptor subunit [Gammaproteobacteria bacterium]|nr:efflux RND transporter periplasmic adaptor subunit [Gammaproteobacteria bacterium]